MDAVVFSAPRVADARHLRQYRPEIQGLRAVAVMSVILFHVRWGPFSGGYVGVDIFFVISGFLITRNILADREAGIWSFGRFYLRRIRRLFPALAATLLLTLAAGFLFFSPDDMARLGQTALFSVASMSNVLFWREAGYFDASAAVKPLLHTWSLSVEEHFYLIWPALIVCASLIGRSRAVAAMVIAAGAVSFVAAEIVAPMAPDAVFYLMPFRMFEFCTGAAFAVTLRRPCQNPFWAQIAMIAGLSALAYSVTCFDSATLLHPFWPLLPCIGAALVIYAGDTPWSGMLLSNTLTTAIGAISYSLYLVHWPIVVFYRYSRFEELRANEKLLLVALCFVVATATYRLVELPFRSGATDRMPVGTRAALGIAAAMGVCVLAIGGHAWYSNGWAFRLPNELRSIPPAEAMWVERNPFVRLGKCFVYTPVYSFSNFDEDLCLKLEPAKPNYLIFGDSLAADAYMYLSAAYPNVNFLQATAGSCRPLTEFAIDEPCNSLLRFIFTKFIPTTKQLDGVVLAARWRPEDDREPDLLDKTIDTLRTESLRVILVGDGPRFLANVPDLIFQSKRITKVGVEAYVDQNIHSGQYALNDTMKRRFLAKVSSFIDIQSILCEDHCRIFTPDGKMIYIDLMHLTVAGAHNLAPKVATRYGNIFPGIIH